MGFIRTINSGHFRHDNSGLVQGVGMWDVLEVATGRIRRDWHALGRCRGGSLPFRANPDEWGVLFENRTTAARVWFHMSAVQTWHLECELRRQAAPGRNPGPEAGSALFRRVVSF